MGKVLDYCCCCIELKTGCLIMGYLSLISDIYYAFITWITIGIVSQEPEHFGKIYSLILGVLYIYLLIIILNLTFLIIFLTGLHGNKPGRVKAFLIYRAICVALEYIAKLYVTIKTEPDKTKTAMIAAVIIMLLIEIYFLLVVQSQYIEMKNPTTRAIVYSPAINSPVVYNPATNNPVVYSPATNTPLINNPSVSWSNPGFVNYPVNGPSLCPAINSRAMYHATDSPSAHNSSVNGTAINNPPAYNHSAYNPPAYNPPPYSSSVSGPATNYPTKYQ